MQRWNSHRSGFSQTKDCSICPLITNTLRGFNMIQIILMHFPHLNFDGEMLQCLVFISLPNCWAVTLNWNWWHYFILQLLGCCCWFFFFKLQLLPIILQMGNICLWTYSVHTQNCRHTLLVIVVIWFRHL